MLLAALFAALEIISVTNHAGHVLTAHPVSLTNGVAVLERTNGERVRVPLRAFPESEKKRLRRALGEELAPELTAKQKRQYLFYQDLSKRNEALHKAGVTDDLAYEKRRKELDVLMKKALNAQDVK